MSRRRVAALTALIVVPVVALAIVLESVLDDGGSSDQSPSATQPANRPAEPDRRQPSKPPTAPDTGAGGAKAPDNPLSLLDSGTPPKQLSEKLAPASEDGTIALGELRGTPIVLNVWSADCLPCRAEQRVLES